MKLSRSISRPLALIGLPALLVTVAGGVLATPASAAEGTIRDAGSASVVKNSYVVVLKSSTGVPSAVKSLTGKYGGKVGHTYSHALGGFEVSVGEAAAKKLAADPKVSYVQKNGIFTIKTTQSSPPWGLDRIDQRALPLSTSYTYDTTASNVHAYIIDTGIRLTHSQFGGRAVSGTDAVDNDTNATDCNGHGTHVAGTVGGSTYGVAKAVQLVAVRVLDCEGSGTTAGVVAGIDWVTANAIKPAVANMSLGGGVDSVLDAAVNRSIAAGITYGVASGNETANACNSSPSRVANAITVNATTRTDAKASFSNFGTCTDIFAPGQDILSSWYTSDSATNTISGTSMATPHVVGAAALILAANPSFTPAQVASAMIAASTPNVVTSPGTGSPNRLLYTGATTTTPTPTPTATTAPPTTGCTGTSGTDVTIPDAGAAVTSSIAISGCARSASSTSTVAVNIVHTYRGDVVVDLVAPDGTSYRLKASSTSDSADNINTTYTVNLSSEAANGTWLLKAQDIYSADTGYINSWTLTV
ncbi:MAG TPA: S8 family serine peptidase [Kineosporiaceae bacterium]|nr:S8 family serine peptidase [Kineosporiaceae bacterium]